MLTHEKIITSTRQQKYKETNISSKTEARIEMKHWCVSCNCNGSLRATEIINLISTHNNCLNCCIEMRLCLCSVGWRMSQFASASILEVGWVQRCTWVMCMPLYHSSVLENIEEFLSTLRNWSRTGIQKLVTKSPQLLTFSFFSPICIIHTYVTVNLA